MVLPSGYEFCSFYEGNIAVCKGGDRAALTFIRALVRSLCCRRKLRLVLTAWVLGECSVLSGTVCRYNLWLVNQFVGRRGRVG